MATERMLALTWRKQSASTPWVLSMENASEFTLEVSVGDGGKTAAGPRLQELLLHMESEIKSYPFFYDMRKIANGEGRTLRAQVLNGLPMFVEADVPFVLTTMEYFAPSPYKQLEEQVKLPEGIDAIQPITQMNLRLNARIATTIKNEFVSGDNIYWVFMKSESVGVINGHGLSGYVEGYVWPNGKSVPKKVGNQDLSTKQVTVEADYLGVKDFALDNASNALQAKYYHVTPNVLTAAGNEALNYNKKLIKDKSMIALSLQYDTQTGRPVSSDNGRLLTVAYATDYQSFEEVKAAIQTGHFKGININKSLLKEQYSKASDVKAENPHSVSVPLVEFNGYTEFYSNHALDMSSWAAELSLSKPPNEASYQELVKQNNLGKETEDKIVENTMKYAINKITEKGSIREESIPTGYINNDLAFVKPLDDRLESGELYRNVSESKTPDDISGDLPHDYTQRVRIGDVMLDVPPLMIHVDKKFTNEKVQAMRSKTPLQKQIGHVRNVLTLELYFHDLENINGKKVYAYTEKGKARVFYYMDGMRSLLAQFKKAPFLPIDNDYINNDLGIHNVALRNLSASTVPNFPEAMQVTLVLEEIDISSYMMGETSLADLINYPLLRWHYQSLLHQPSTYQPWRTYLPTIDHLDNKFTFSIVDRKALENRVSAIHEFRRMKVPSKYKDSLLDRNSSKKAHSYRDGQETHQAIKQYETFLSLYKNGLNDKKHVIKVPGNLQKTYKFPSDVPIVAGEGFGYDKLNNYATVGERKAQKGQMYNAGLSFKETELGQQVARALYGPSDTNDTLSKKAPFYRQGFTGALVTEPVSAFFTLRSFSSGKGFLGDYIPEEVFDVISKNNFPGFFQVILEDPDNKKIAEEYIAQSLGFNSPKDLLNSIPTYFNSKTAGGGSVYILPAGNSKGKNALSILKKMAKKKKELDTKVNDYTFRYNALAAEINRTEAELPMIEVPIPGVIPMNMSVEMENNFSIVQVEATETPSMQFFGAQEPKVALTFETDNSGVRALDQMFRTVADYAKKYRDGIVSGYMSINNPLLNLFGLRSVLPDTIQYDTVPGNPGRMLVNVSFLGFDKSQRRQEALYGFVGGAEDKELRDMAYDNYDPRVDSLYINEKIRQMELYPDLEMPKVSELNDALSVINAGMKKWENRQKQVYLDPDFYVSTSSTYRNYLKNMLDDPRGTSVRWEDASGFVAISDLGTTSPLKMKEEDAERFEEEAASAEYSDPITVWENYGEGGIGSLLKEENETKEEENKKNNLTALQTTTNDYKDENLKKWLKKDYQKKPDFKTYNGWYGNKKSKKDYDKFIAESKRNPKESTVWYYLADKIRDNFDDLSYGKGELKALENRKSGLSQSIIKDYLKGDLSNRTWGSTKSFYWSDYNFAQFGKNELKNGIEETLKKDYKDKMADIAKSSFTLRSHKMPFMRVMTHMKTIMTVSSNWQQFSGGKPKVTMKNNQGLPAKVGIMGVDVTGRSKADIQRLMWDWRYNISESVKQMAKVYKQAEKSKFHEIKIRRLDWAIASHSAMELPPIIKSNDKSDDKPYGENNQPIAPEIYQFYQQVVTAWGNEAGECNKEIAPAIYSNTNGKPIKEIFMLYVPVYETNFYQEDDKIDAHVQELMNKEIRRVNENLEHWTVEQKVKGMFTDMYQNDHTGRLLRAFPSFSLLLIDEGKWYGNFRTWDNFYGYNALNSIDVYKSRKIVADTAEIEMSNMYGGLSGMRNDMQDYDLMMPSFFSSQFWEYYVLGKPTDDVIEERREIYESIMLQPGARVNLRMGYGADARYLPTVFNGTITELNADEIVKIVAQGDGLELTNVIVGSPDDTNKEFFKVIEPSDYIGKLLTSKGNWLENYINHKSKGLFYKENPNGIAHFGATTKAESGNYNLFSNEYGESTQNVYSQNGQMTKEQWLKQDGTTISMVESLLTPVKNAVLGEWNHLQNEYDEDNIQVRLYGSTPWDIIQTFSLCSTDYIAAVFPFEMRSSLFFGKPNWPVTYRYDSNYVYDEAAKKMRRDIVKAHQKTFMQAHIYSSQFNIISNNVMASEEGLYNNVIVSYDGRTVGPMQADNDIRLDRQKTAQVEANLVARGMAKKSSSAISPTNYFTTEAQAQRYGHSTVRDFMKDMYKGTYTVLGDATVKPYDICYLSDDVLDMQGIHLVKAVHHSMNAESGFVSHIEPDAYVINFDAELLFMPDKVFAVCKNVILQAVGHTMGLGVSYMVPSVISKLAAQIGKKALSAKAKIPDKLVDGIYRRSVSSAYQLYGKVTGNQTILNMAKVMQDTNTKSGAKKMAKMLKAERAKEVAMINNQFESFTNAEKFIRNTTNNGLDAYNASSDIFTAAKGSDIRMDQSKVMKEMFNSMDDIDDVAEAFAKNTSKSGAFVKGEKSLKNILNKTGTTGKAILSSQLLWTVVVKVGIDIATSGLVEAWTRRKQNAECVKVVPLQYKGLSWTAGMNGHRGGVQGDDPSLADRLYNAEFGAGDNQVDKVWWSFVPKILNLMS